MRALHPDDLKILYPQKGIGWCTVYLMANIFRNYDFLEYLEYPEYRGCQDEQMDTMLRKYATDLSLGLVAISNPSYPRLPKDYVWKLLNFDKADSEIDTGSSIPIACYMLTVRLIDADIWHSVGVLSIWDILYYLDPYNTEMFVLTSAEHLSKQFIDCTQVQRFRMRESDHWALLKGENLGYK